MIAAGVDIDQNRGSKKSYRSHFRWTVGPAALPGIGGSLTLSRASLREAHAIGRRTQAIIADELNRRTPTMDAGDDLDRLTGTLNRMLDRLAVMVESFATGQ